MNVEIEKKNNFTEIRICADKLDNSNALALKSEFVLTASKGERNIILNATECSECDMSGLSALLVADRLCKNANGIFVLTGINDSVQQLLKVAQLEEVLNITDTFTMAQELVETKERA